MQATGGRVDELGEAIEIGADKLVERTVLEDEGDDGVFVFQLDKDIFGCGILLGGSTRGLVGDVEPLVQHFAQLFG